MTHSHQHSEEQEGAAAFALGVQGHCQCAPMREHSPLPRMGRLCAESKTPCTKANASLKMISRKASEKNTDGDYLYPDHINELISILFSSI